MTLHWSPAYGAFVNRSTFVVSDPRLVVGEVDLADEFTSAADFGLLEDSLQVFLNCIRESTSFAAICEVDLPRRTRLVTSCSRSVNPYADMSSGEI